MGAPFRITRGSSTREFAPGERAVERPMDQYFDRLTKLIPAEVLGAYLALAGTFSKSSPVWLAIWTAICVLLVIGVRTWGTADADKGEKPQFVAIAISAVAFLIWVYATGGAFAAYGLVIPELAAILVVLVTFIAPYVYKGTPAA